MKKIMAIMTFLSAFFMMNLPVLADIPVDDSELLVMWCLPIVLIIGIIVIVAAVVLAIFLRKNRTK